MLMFLTDGTVMDTAKSFTESVRLFEIMVLTAMQCQ
jgi:hypothetical protein